MKKVDLASHFNEILDAIHEDVLITDGEGVVLKVSPTFEKMYAISSDYALGKTVYDLEKEGFFKPSIIAKVIRSGEQVTMEQVTKSQRRLVVTATPVYGENDEIDFVVSFSRDITEMLELQAQYSKLENKMEKYTAELHELRKESTLVDCLIGPSEPFQKILKTLKRVAPFDANILFLGPSGVGKSTLARVTHQLSSRKDGPFIDINCAAIPDNLLESELFGYEKGAFTGAGEKGKIGLIELANGGTLLLDEISELPLNLQAKLLKTIQNKVISRIGGTKDIEVDFRLIAATNRDLEAYAEEGRFRKDLYYRLNVISIDVPPIKDTPEDVIPLAEHFLEKINKQYNLHKSFHPLTLEAMIRYSWPGNIREISNIVERIALTSEGDVIMREHLPKEIEAELAQADAIDPSEVTDLESALRDFEEQIIRSAYEKYGTTVGVGKALNISQPTAHRKISKYIGKGNSNMNS